MKTLKGILAKVARFFQGGKAEQVFDQVAELAEQAAPIVEEIAKLTPNRRDDEIVAAYLHFGLPVVRSIESTPADQRGYLLLDLATKVMAQRYPLATNILQSAVQLAVTGMKASGERK